MPTEFTEYVERAESADHELWLGRLLYYTISEETRVDHAEFCATLIQHGIDYLLPPQPRPSDVFKRACVAAVKTRRRVPTYDPNVFMKYLIRDVGSDSDTIWRSIVQERVNAEGHQLDYDEIYQLKFTRATSRLDITLLIDKPPTDTAIQIAKDVAVYFDLLNNKIGSHTVRELIRKMMTALNATIVRPSGGLYFVREQHAQQIDTLELIVSSLPGGNTFHSIPLIDDRKQRSMLKRAFEDESIGEIDRLLGDMGELLKKRQPITSDHMADFKMEYDRLRGKVLDYSNLLDEAMEQTASRLEIMADVLFELLGLVKV